jgi:uncharacterized protein (TIGR03437 family)
VNFNGQSSPTETLNIVDTVPGVYTRSVAGAGPVTAVNQNGSNNSKVNPAPKGTVITVYASGLGAISPVMPAGSVPPTSPLSLVTGNVGAFTGGVPSTVQFAGAAPGFPGLYQLNIQVPTGASSGTQELLIYLNGKSSQKGATVEIQ